MPYLTQGRKDELAAGDVLRTPGDLNYMITRRLLGFVEWYRTVPPEAGIAALQEDIEALIGRYIEQHGASYTTYNSIMGALDCCKREWCRRTNQQRKWLEPGRRAAVDCVKQKAKAFYAEVVGPYEDLKIEENGDVYL